MSQHAGAPAEPLVKVGDTVLAGQKIGDVDARITAPVHAPITGTVIAVEPRPCVTVTARRGSCVVIEADRGEATDEETEGVSEPTPDTIRAAVREAGVVGLGGAGFPTHVKLSPPPDRTVDTVIINGCECESYLTADHRVMVEDPEPIIEGATLVMTATGAGRCVIAIEDNKPDAIEAMRSAAAGRVEVVAVKSKYPQGAEKLLIKTLTGRTYPAGKLPSDVGVAVQNVQTTKAIRDAVREGKPLVERVITVTGAVVKPKNLRVRIGTRVGDLIEQCGGFAGTPGKLIMGGPLTGIALPDTNVPVVKGTSGIVVLAAGEVEQPVAEVPPCIRCGRCVKACPTTLLPNFLGTLSAAGMAGDAADRYHLFSCIECASCAYVCPSKIPLLQLIRLAKAEAMLEGTTK